MKSGKKYVCVAGILGLFLGTACTSSSRQAETEKENTYAKQQLQGWWLDEVTETPVFRMQGDTLYYNDPSSAPVAFKVVKDSLKTYGSQPTAYYIEKINEYSLSIQSIQGDILELRKAENEFDSIQIQPTPEEEPEVSNVLQKDRIVYYNDIRYRGYVYINPSNTKVAVPTMSDQGFEVDNIYYDNIIHICVFDGKKKLFSKDIHKQFFEGILSDEFLQRSILSDMDFIDVTANGYHYQATLCIPNAASCYLVNLFISFQGEITYELAD